MWHEVVSKEWFSSRVHEPSDDLASGKWLLPVPIGDPARLWERIEEMAEDGEVVAAKISSHRLDSKLGFHLVCVYCRYSDESSVAGTLAVLRGIGVVDELRYKSDRATYQNRDDYLWVSPEGSLAVEPWPSERPSEMPPPKSIVQIG